MHTSAIILLWSGLSGGFSPPVRVCTSFVETWTGQQRHTSPWDTFSQETSLSADLWHFQQLVLLKVQKKKKKAIEKNILENHVLSFLTHSEKAF